MLPMPSEQPDYENVVQLYISFIGRLKAQLEINSYIGLEPWQSLLEEAYQIKDLLNNPIISQPLNNAELKKGKKQNPVDKYGMQSLVISLYEDGLGFKKIAEYLEAQGLPITNTDVSDWIKDYSVSDITTQVELSNGSVFDTQFQLQDLFDKIYKLLQEIQIRDDADYKAAKTTKEQVKLEIYKELRMSVKDAATLATAVANMQTIENFKKIVIEEVNKLDPGTAQRIWKKIREAKSMFSSLNP